MRGIDGHLERCLCHIFSSIGSGTRPTVRRTDSGRSSLEVCRIGKLSRSCHGRRSRTRKSFGRRMVGRFLRMGGVSCSFLLILLSNRSTAQQHSSRSYLGGLFGLKGLPLARYSISRFTLILFLLTFSIDGYARKIHYTCDLFFALSWGAITGFNSPFPWFYPVFFTCMIIHRAVRDIQRCRAKYGKAWEEYERQVPYLFIPVSSIPMVS